MIRLLGDPILRWRARSVPRVADPRLQRLIDAMTATMKAVQGVGLAAPQVGHSLRLFIVASHPNPRYPTAPRMNPLVMLNPRLLRSSRRRVRGWEGCLSIPGLRGSVPRSQKVWIEYTSRQGDKVRQALTGFVARIFQHEYDHINGKVFLDRVRSTRNLMTEAEYAKQTL